MSYLKILVVEDEKYFRALLAHELATYGRVFQADNIKDAENILSNNIVDVALIDINLTNSSKMEGIELAKIAQENGILPIMLTSHDSPAVIGKAFQNGCSHYFTKNDFEKNIHALVGPLLSGIQENKFDRLIEHNFLTKNIKLRSQLKHACENTRSSDQKILITGKTGVGKTHFAKLLHNYWNAAANFVHINLSEIPENLLESELFGHKKGAFTGAIQDKKGLLQKAFGGTLFLDEIGTLPLSVQKKLLRVIEEKSFSPIGSTDTIKGDFRLICATCDDLAALIEAGDFRLDLYFRIKGFELFIPELKDRKEDIPELINNFIAASPKKIAFDSESITLLEKYQWFGNIREVKNTIQSLINTSSGIITKKHLPVFIQNNKSPFESKACVGQSIVSPSMLNTIKTNGLPYFLGLIEKEVLTNFLEQYDGKINEVVRKLKISKSVFYRIQKTLDNDNGVNQNEPEIS